MSPNMAPERSISLDTARTLAIIKQGLHQRPPKANRQALLESIRRIGLLQLDTVNVVARSHYLVMLSRAGLYDPPDLDGLLYPDRHLFQGWAHAACLIPVEDYDYFAPLLWERRQSPLQHWRLNRLGDNPKAVLDEVLAEIRKQGPMASKDFKNPTNHKGSWWNWKPAKIALDILHWRGELMIDRRVNFQMYYDLAERVLPASAEPPSKTKDDWHRWATLRSVERLGVATAAHVSDYYRQRTPATRERLSTLAPEGAVVPIAVEEWKDTAYILPADLPLLDQIERGKNHQPTVTTFLSPFDNLTWNRDRLSELFGFDYRIEMYTPKAQRKYGYYVMPILHNGRFVGRIDPKADRKNKTLLIQALYLESGEKITDELLDGIAGALREFMLFHESEQVVIERTEPEALETALQKRIQDSV